MEKAKTLKLVVSWSRMSNEPEDWHEKFKYFVLLNSDRTIEKACKNFCRDNQIKFRQSFLKIWEEKSIQFKWLDRAEAWDKGEEQRKIAREKLQRKKELEELENTQKAIGMSAIYCASEIISKVSEFIKKDLTKDQINVNNLPKLLRIAIPLANMGLNTLSESYCIPDVIDRMNIKQLKESLDENFNQDLDLIIKRQNNKK